jgi:hypothetical protein
MRLKAFFTFTAEKIYMNKLLAALIAGAVSATGTVVAAASAHRKIRPNRGNRPGRIDDIPRNLASRPQSLI